VDNPPAGERLISGTLVVTMQPAVESEDWQRNSDDFKNRRWGVLGRVVACLNGHGLTYRVEHEDGTRAWYEPRELRRPL
jgi:hypothetical protein